MGRQNLTGILVLAAINLFFGLATPGIDNWAHMGGLAAGFLVGLVLAPNYRHEPTVGRIVVPYRSVDINSLARKWWVLPAAGAVLAAGTWLGTATLPDNVLSRLYSAERHLERQSYEKVLEEIGQAVRLDPREGRTYYVLGKLLVELGDTAGARRELFRAVALASQAGDGETVTDASELLSTLPQ